MFFRDISMGNFALVQLKETAHEVQGRRTYHIKQNTGLIVNLWYLPPGLITG